MIRAFSNRDMAAVLDVWLSASIQAHDFVAKEFWHSQLDAMRSLYIPASEVFVFEKDAQVVGFYALLGDRLAAIFVAPALQGEGLGKSLLSHAKSMRSSLSLSVYKANPASLGFYQSQGFAIIEERVDEATGQAEYLMVWGAGAAEAASGIESA